MNLNLFESVSTIILDVDGTLTDGRISIDDNGIETKYFNVKDGMAISQAIKHSIDIVIITGRFSKSVDFRCEELGIVHNYQGIKNKKVFLFDLCKKYGFDLNQSLFIGDDINDLGVMKAVKFSGCPKNACPEVKKICTVISNFNGGDGAVREIIEFVLKDKEIWKQIIVNYQHASQ